MSAQKVKVAAIQFSAEPGAVQKNLQCAGELVRQAASRGARLILLPELTPGGYVLTEKIWDSAETMHGESVSWLKSLAQQFSIYLGMSFLEAEGTDFFNSFVLATPTGDIAGRVRKAPPASAEAYFFRSGTDPHYIDTDLGRIGVSICYEALLHQYQMEHHRYNVDIVLIPMSAGTPTPVFPIRKRDCRVYNNMLRGLAAHHAQALGVPVVMANKCGPLVTAMPSGLPAQDTSFPGLSTIADSDGLVKDQLGSESGIALGEVSIDSARKAATAPTAYGRWSLPVPWFSFFFPLAAFFGTRVYAKSRVRAERAAAAYRAG
jgi:N-carbamoylputrescine amidase